MPPPARSRRLLTGGVLLLTCLIRSAVAAQSDSALNPQPRYVLTSSLGLPLRLAVHDKFDQRWHAPWFADALLGYVFPSQARFAHGAGLGVSLNLSKDGGFTEPIAVTQQFVVMPSYLLYYALAPDLFALAHAGIPIALTADKSAGFEAAAALGFRVLAGFGAYTEAGLDLFGGANTTVHPLLTLEVGLFLEYEVLP